MIVQLATTTAAVCGAVVMLSAAVAVVVKLAHWAYDRTEREHRIDELLALGEPLAKVVEQLSPNHGSSMFDRVTHLATEAFPELLDRFVPVEQYVEELKARDRRRTRNH